MKKILILLTASILSLFGATFNVSTTPELRTALTTAATNGEDDTIIIADGTYKTTDDGQGTFIYLSNEANKLTLQGSSTENAILSGDSQHQILNHKSTKNAPMTLEKLSFVDGNNTSGNGGGVYTDYTVEVLNCHFSNNTVKGNNSLIGMGGGIYFEFSLDNKIINSTFNSNEAREGGGFYSYYAKVEVINSIFHKNKSIDNGGGFVSYVQQPVIKNSIFKLNSSGYNGGAFFAYSNGCSFDRNLKIENSIFTSNVSSYGNSDSFYSANNNTEITNSLFSSENTNIYLSYCDKHVVSNNIFINNVGLNLDGDSNTIILKLENNYIDVNTLTVNNFNSNNIFNEVTLGFVDEANGDYRLTESSGLIDKGTSTITGLTLPTTDLDGNARIVGGGIDIGPYEFSTTKPTITAFTNSGTAKELSALTFNVVYSLSSGRTLGNISYDYSNDGSWTSLNTHTFSTAGTYTVNVKVTDSAGEYSVNSLQVTVAQLPFSEMTDEQKLIKAVNPIYYDAIVEIINKKSQVNTLTTNTISTLENSWSLIGSSTAITDLSIFNDASIIWTYVDGAWNAYSSNSTTRQKIIDANIPLITNIPANSGIWVNK